ncbi:MAG TPA: PAS domain S-box protein [Stenomitos sp.]
MNSSTSTKATNNNSSDPLDLTTVIQTLDSLVGEVNLEPLMATLMRIVIETTGAQKGFLLLNRNGQLFIEAGESVVGQSIPVETSEQLPVSVIYDVASTQKDLVLDHARSEGSFTTDPYICQHQSKSIWCAPICGQGQLIGIFYLENNITTRAFNSEQAQILRLLCLQAAITLQNAQLYQQLKDYSQQLEHQLEEHTQDLTPDINLSEVAQTTQTLRLTQFAVDHSVDAIIWIASDSRHVYVNDAACRLTGYTKEELLASTVCERNPNFTLATWQQHWQDIKQQGSLVFETHLFSKQGRLIPLEVSSNYVEVDGQGYICAFCRDIATRKQAEQALRESANQIRTITDNIPALVAYVDNQECYQFVNQQYTELMKIPASEIIGKSVRDIFDPAIYERRERYVKAALSGKKVCFEDVYPNDGKEQYWEITLIPHQSETGVTVPQEPIKVSGYFVFAQNITKRKQAEIALKRSELKFRNIFENSLIGIFRTRISDGLVLEVNQRGVEMMGYNCASEVIGQKFSQEFYANPEDRQRMLDQVYQQGAVKDFEMQFRQQDGSIRWGLFGVRLDAEAGCFEGVITDISDRKRLEQELLHSQRFLDSIIENIPLSLFAKDVNNEFRNVLWNKTCEQMFGIPREQALGRNVYDFQPTEQADFFQAKDLEAVSQGQLIKIAEEPFDTQHRGRILLRTQKLPLFDSQGQPTHLLCISEDITERQRREEALRLIFEGTASKTGDEFFRACVRSLAEVLGVRYTFVAEWANAVKTSSRTLAFWQGETWGENFEYDLAEYPCENVLAGKTCYYPEGVQALFPKSLELVELAAQSYLGTPLIDPCGNVLGNLVVLDTKPMDDDPDRELILRIFAARAGAELKRKQAEEALQRRAQVDSLLSSISRQFLDQDIDSAINFTLQAIGQFLGATRCNVFEYDHSQSQAVITHQWFTEPSQSSIHDIPVLLVETDSWLHDKILRGKPVQIPRVTDLPPQAAANKAKLQQESIESIVAVPMVHSGKVVGLIGLETVYAPKVWTQADISLLKLVGELVAMGQARHNAEEAMRLAKEAAEGANRAKSAFLANMSHELRTPLNAILGFSQLMTHDPWLTPEQQQNLNIISRSGEHLLTLINDVLEMSKIEAGRTTLHQQSFNLYRLLDDLEEMLQLKAKSKGLQLTFERTPDVPQFVKTDESKLRQVLLNLLGNAIKFTQAGRVTLRVRLGHGEEETRTRVQTHSSHQPCPPHLWFEVEDTGPGIAPQEIDQLFEAFVQTETGRNSQQGTGLGLAITRQFVKMMGGEITVSSRLGEGTLFKFKVQVSWAEVTAEPTQHSHQRVLQLAPDQPQYRILVVEDTWENRQLLVKRLEMLDFDVRAAANGQEAIAVWENWHPHLIWMDMRMPVMDGYEATRQIKAQPQGGDTVIIALTASAFEEERGVALAAGCDDFVRKPVQEEVILAKMAQYLGVRYLYQQPPSPNFTPEPGTPDSQTVEALGTAELAMMPESWVIALHQAATELDGEVILQLLGQIPEAHRYLKEMLTEWLHNFRFDQIIQFTQGSTSL